VAAATGVAGAAALARFHAAESARFAARHPACAELAARGAGHMLYGVPLHWMSDWGTPLPLHVQEARGTQLSCADGHLHTDFCLADTAAMFGHSPPKLVEALARRLPHGLGAMLPGEDAVVATSLLAQRFGLPFWQVALSASDANRFCLRWARAVTGRPRLLVFDGCYHGTVDDALVDRTQGPDGSAQVRPRASLLGQVHDGAAHTACIPFNDRAALEAELARGDVACVLAEPVMTNVGMVLPEPGFLAFLRAACTRTGTLLLLDETHTLSSGPGGHGLREGVAADLLVLGKAIAGGVPCAVYGFTAELAARMRAAKDAAPPGHSGVGTTLAGNLLAMAALRATLEAVATPQAHEAMEARACQLEAGLVALLARHRLDWCVSRVGARCEFQFCAMPPRNGAQARAAMHDALEAALHLGLLNRGVAITPFHNMLLCAPETSAEDVARLLAALDEVLLALREAGALEGQGG
jgi:glutamate-1-semialdehyde 2,1-aminomutase